MPQELRLIRYAIAAHHLPILPHLFEHFDDVIKMALRINAARESETHQLERRGKLAAGFVEAAKHHAADFDAANAAVDIKRIH